MSKLHSYPIYEHLLVVGATSELFSFLVPKLIPYVKKFTCVGRDAEILKKLELSYPKHIETVCLDLLNKDDFFSIQKLLSTQEYDGLLQLQGFGIYGRFETVDFQDHEKIFNLNFTIPAKIAHLFIRLQKQPNKKKIILNASSLAGEVYCPYLASYSAAKSALTHLTKTLHIENLEHFICVALCPKSFGQRFSFRASNGKFCNDNSINDYTKDVVDSFFKVLIQKKTKTFCTFFDWILSKLYFFVPKIILRRSFRHRLMRK